MSPNEKALKLIEKMRGIYFDLAINEAKAAAIIAVNEILHLCGLTPGQIDFWQCVHDELNNR